MERMGLEQIPEQTTETGETTTGKAQTRKWGRVKIPILRYFIIAVLCYNLGRYQHLPGREDDRAAQEVGGEGRECVGGHPTVDPSGRRRVGVGSTQTATKSAEPNLQVTSEAWEKGECHPSKGSTNAEFSAKYPPTCGSRKTEAQKRNRSITRRNQRSQTTAAEPQVGETCRGDYGSRLGRDLGQRRRGEGAAQTTVGQGQQRADANETTGGLHAAADGAVHAELPDHQRSHDCATSERAATQYTGAATQETGPWICGIYPRNGIGQRRTSSFRRQAPISRCQGCSITLRTCQRSGGWYGLNPHEDESSADCEICRPVQGMRQSCTMGNMNGLFAMEQNGDIYELLRGSAQHLADILLALGFTISLWFSLQFCERVSKSKGIPKLCVILLICSIVNASEDEQIRRAFRVRRQAEALQADQICRQRWQRITQNYGLQIPDRNNDYEAVIHRPDASPMPSPTALTMLFRYQSDTNPIQHVLNVERS